METRWPVLERFAKLGKVNMKLSWNNIANIGVDETVDPSEVKYINLVNILAIFIFFFELSNMIIFIPYLPQMKFLLFFGTVIGILNLGVVLLNYFKFYLAARVSFGLLAVLLITVISVSIGRKTLMHVFLLESIVIAFFIYPPRDKVFRNAIISLFATSFVGLEIWFTHHTA